MENHIPVGSIFQEIVENRHDEEIVENRRDEEIVENRRDEEIVENRGDEEIVKVVENVKRQNTEVVENVKRQNIEVVENVKRQKMCEEIVKCENDEEFDINCVNDEQKYIIDKLWKILQDKEVSVSVTNSDHKIYTERRLKNYIDRFVKNCDICKTDCEKVNAVIDLLHNIYMGIYTTGTIRSSSLQISSFNTNITPEYIKSNLNNIKIYPTNDKELDSSKKKNNNSPSALFWITFGSGTQPKLFFMGTRFDKSDNSVSDPYKLYSNGNTPFMYFLNNLSSKIEKYLNSSEFREMNPTIKLTDGTILETEKYFKKPINVDVKILGCRKSDFCRFEEKSNGQVQMSMVSKSMLPGQIENYEIISLANAIQLKMFVSEDGVDAIICIWNKIGIVI